MRYILDTDICIYLFHNKHPEIRKRFNRCEDGDIVLSSVTVAELARGVSMAGDQKETEEKNLRALVAKLHVLPFGEKEALIYGMLCEISANRQNAFDRMIAAQAIANDCILVTNNTKDYRVFEGKAALKTENWLESLTKDGG